MQPVGILMDTAMPTNGLPALRLMQLVSPALPIGAFTYSQGLEWAIETQWVKNEDDLQLEAELVSLNNDAVSYFQVKDAFDKTHTFLIKEQFEGYKLLKKSNYNKTFNIYYKEINMFDLSERKYVKKKVVKYLESID